MMIYVVDFKMSCKEKDMAALWGQFEARIWLSPYKRSDRYFGCYSRRFCAPLNLFAPLWIICLRNGPALMHTATKTDRGRPMKT